MNQVGRSPTQTALQDRGRSLSYGQLARRVERIRSLLEDEGVGPGSRVGLHGGRTLEGIAGMLGILQSGAAVVPLSPSDPPGRRDELLRFAEIRTVVDTPETPFPVLPGWTGTVVRSDGSEAAVPGTDPVGGEEDSPAFILRSSGSTDKPKLIVRSHGSFAHRLHWTWNRHPFQSDEMGCQKAQLSTTHSIYELFEPLLQGVPVLLVPDDDVRRLERFWELVDEAGVTRLLLVPSALRASLDLPGFRPPPLTSVVLMGEYVAPRLAERAIRTFPPRTHLYSIYGSTEASSTLACDLRASFRPERELPLGVPLSEQIRVRVLDADRRPVPPGGTGRLYLSGPPLFREYLGDPHRTSAAFVELGGEEGLFYDTRDDVRVERGGALAFVGRTDHTVKIRGFRVDLHEVEGALLRHPGVTQAVAVARGKDAASPRLDAWLTPASIDPTRVFARLRQQLPEYMVPASIQPVDTFPLTASGKVDRRRLADLARSGPAPVGADPIPGESVDRTTEAVTSAWETVLGHRDFGLDASFFEVGGTSLTAFRVVQAIRSSLGLGRTEIDEVLLYRFPTIRGLAGALMPGRHRNGNEPPTGQSPLLVTLRGAGEREGGGAREGERGWEKGHAPLFLLPSSGGTVGVYQHLVRKLQTPREIVGLRDPYLWGDRDPELPFAAWAARYVEAIRSRQPSGPYFLAAYSSGGAFGFEVARQLRMAGQAIGLLVLVDPLGLDRPHRKTFGFWASRAAYGNPIRRAVVRGVGHARALLHRMTRTGRAVAFPNEHALTADEVSRLTGEAMESPGQILALSALLEMNTGRPVALFPQDLQSGNETPFRLLLERTAEAGLEVDPERLERMARQYPLQVRAQQHYRLQYLDAPVLLVEPRTRYQGLIRLNLRPHLPALESLVIPLGEPSERVAALSERFGAWAPHFRCIRDEAFVAGLARAMDARLDTPAHR